MIIRKTNEKKNSKIFLLVIYEMLDCKIVCTCKTPMVFKGFFLLLTNKDVIFLFTSLARDVTPITESTSEYIHGYGDRIYDINLSGHPRRTNKYNYFDNGYSQKELDKYVELICGVFSKYE